MVSGLSSRKQKLQGKRQGNNLGRCVGVGKEGEAGQGCVGQAQKAGMGAGKGARQKKVRCGRKKRKPFHLGFSPVCPQCPPLGRQAKGMLGAGMQKVSSPQTMSSSATCPACLSPCLPVTPMSHHSSLINPAPSLISHLPEWSVEYRA